MIAVFHVKKLTWCLVDEGSCDPEDFVDLPQNGTEMVLCKMHASNISMACILGSAFNPSGVTLVTMVGVSVPAAAATLLLPARKSCTKRKNGVDVCGRVGE